MVRSSRGPCLVVGSRKPVSPGRAGSAARCGTTKLVQDFATKQISWKPAHIHVLVCLGTVVKVRIYQKNPTPSCYLRAHTRGRFITQQF